MQHFICVVLGVQLELFFFLGGGNILDFFSLYFLQLAKLRLENTRILRADCMISTVCERGSAVSKHLVVRVTVSRYKCFGGGLASGMYIFNAAHATHNRHN